MTTAEYQSDLCGILNVHKPRDCTSRDVVNRVQRIIGRKVKVGHAGTLDPLATGVLLVCIGRATKLIPVIHEFSKSYQAGFTLGLTSNTDDSTGEIEHCQVQTFPTRDQVQRQLEQQVGTFMQTPPAFSAVKVNGRRAYKAARQGQQVTIRPRPVTVLESRVIEYQYPHVSVSILCGSGTYIRSIARDLGDSLGTGGLMDTLTRSAIGPFKLENAVPPEAIEKASPLISPFMHSVETLFQDWATHMLSDQEIQLLRNGKPLEIDGEQNRLVATTKDGKFAAVLERIQNSSDFRATINWVPSWFANV